MTDAASYPIRLEQLFFLRCSVIAVQGHDFSPGTVGSPVNNLVVNKDAENPHRFSVQMRSVLNPAGDKSEPYSIDMECMAVMVTDGTLTPEESHRGVTINGNSVCYGAIRETVAWLTARQPYGPLLLGLSVLQPASMTTPQ